MELGAYVDRQPQDRSEGPDARGRGRGSIVFEVLSPYIIVPIMDDLDDPDNFGLNRDAATILTNGHGSGAGRGQHQSRPDVDEAGPLASGDRLDLTRYVRGTYGYLVRLTMEGKSGEAVLQGLELRTWGQIAPISIPRLAKGKNVLHLGVNDPHKQPTRLVPVLPDLGVPGDIETYGIKIDGKYTPQDVKQRIVGPAVVPVQAPPGELIEWLSVGGMFQALRGQQAKDRQQDRDRHLAGRPLQDRL